ncbi:MULTISPECIES: response regulator transcription factor [unclassified Achromobacter]|uniref:response regulator transcription factor n=1 Tax=unclassified Achromobacter TaxID=2626865 RepID=UPI000B51792E|nr:MULTISPECIES: response regulator transcription factor [unclassified Achromobacter]OWT77336.1 DNA-binding response regulator [Achromobacter sp. HZ28]OWT78217.1 DNA-binding response regulator [Achromobacter sp. HZ34]
MPQASDNKLVMLVDDTPDNLKMLSDALDEAGYMVVVATDGASALERLDFVLPDIVLMDALMPVMDGFEACRRIKAHPVAGHVPVVFMTGLTEPEHVVRGFQAGGIDYVTKPIDTDVVLARLDAHLRNARIMSVAMNAMDAVANAVVVLDGQGQVTWKTSKARLWLSEYFAHPENAAGLPPVLATWIAQQLERPRTEDAGEFTVVAGATSAASAATAPAAGKRELRLRLTASRKAGEYVLLMDERELPAAAADTLAAAYQLTAREGEVLHWLAKGKTNRDIGEILGMAPRTVNKHLEHVYVKLGVETRAAATALVLTHMHKGSA